MTTSQTFMSNIEQFVVLEPLIIMGIPGVVLAVMLVQFVLV